MSDVQQTVDELRFLLQRETVEQSDELTRLVREYARLCHEVNVRLRRCEECLKQGLRSEALHLAEAAPNLLELVATLDFAEAASLAEVAAMYFLPPPEPLLLDVASELNEAYALQEPLNQLLDAHRLLVLGRCSLSQRLPVLRSLAELDETSPHWEDDIREMELARLSQLDEESRAAASRGDVTTLKSLAAEVQAPGWRVDVPATLQRSLKARFGDTARKQAQQRIGELNTQLHAAFSALDVDTARRLRDEWTKKQMVAQLTPQDPLWEQVAPVLDWLTDEDRKHDTERAYAKAVTGIERALEREELTADELKQLGAAVDRHERSLPPVLESRYRNRLSTLEVTEGRRRTLLIAAGAVAVVLVVGVFGIAIYSSYAAEQTRRLAAAVEAFIDDGKLEEARQLMDRQPAGLASESWLAVRKKLADAEEAERDRLVQWRADLEIVEQAAGPVPVEAVLKRLREAARTADEKIAVGKLQGAWQQQVQAEVADREQRFRSAATATTEALVALDRALATSDGTDRDALQNLLETVDQRIAPLRSLRGTVAPELASQAELLESRLQASRKTLGDLARKVALLDKLTDAAFPQGVKPGATPAVPYEVALREFVAALPHDPQAAAFQAAAQACPLPAVRGRQQLLDRWKRLLPAHDKDVELRLRELRAFLSEHPQSPDRESLNRYASWLSSVQRRFSDQGDPDEGVKRRLALLFQSKFIASGHVLRHKDGRTFYLPEERTTAFGSVASFTYYVGFNDESKPANLPPADLIQQKTEPPPQAAIAKGVRDQLPELGLSNWREYFLTLAEKLLQARQVDPFLRYLLVLKTLEFAGLGDQLLEQELEPVLARLNDDELDRSVTWMDPDNRSAKRARERAVELLAAVPPLAPYFTRASQREELLEREVFARRFSIGWLEQTHRGEWVCRTNWTPAVDHVLHVVSRPNADGAREWREVGRVRGSQISLHPGIAEACGVAAVVFASPPVTEAKTALSP